MFCGLGNFKAQNWRFNYIWWSTTLRLQKKKNLSKQSSVSSSCLAVYESSSRALPKLWEDSLIASYLFFGLKRNFKTSKVTILNWTQKDHFIQLKKWVSFLIVSPMNGSVFYVICPLQVCRYINFLLIPKSAYFLLPVTLICFKTLQRLKSPNHKICWRL